MLVERVKAQQDEIASQRERIAGLEARVLRPEGLAAEFTLLERELAVSARSR